MKFNKNSSYDIDLPKGEAAEAEIASILMAQRGGKVEVKSEFSHWQRTRNIAVEYECRGKPSGIAVTKADWWVSALYSGSVLVASLMVPVPLMKTIARRHLKAGKTKKGGDTNASKMVLIPINDIINDLAEMEGTDAADSTIRTE